MYRITQVLSVGRFASVERAEDLRAAGVTHVLNVSSTPGVVAATPGGFREVAWIPLDDSRRLPTHVAAQVLDVLHRMASEPGAQVYVHCIAGQVRSPTILWLYLIACGIPPTDARDWIEERSPDAAPGSSRMIDDTHVLFAQMHGLNNYFPLVRGEIIVPIPIEPPE